MGWSAIGGCSLYDVTASASGAVGTLGAATFLRCWGTVVSARFVPGMPVATDLATRPVSVDFV